MRLSDPPFGYSKTDQAEMRRELMGADARNLKKGEDATYSGDANKTAPRLIIVSPNGTRYRLLVDNAGALSTVAV
jgi:hypothetical protein